jgi:carbamoyl-phosphate synthase large subunit
VSVYRNASTQENGEAMKKKRVLFTGGGGSGTTALWRLLGGKYELYFADADIRNIPPVIPSHRRVSVPLASEPTFVGSLLRSCDDREIDVLVPGVDEELADLAELPGRYVMAPSKAFVRTALDKQRTTEALFASSLDVPINVASFPVILKPGKGRGSRGLHLVSSEAQIDAWRILYNQEPVMQELLHGTEYTCMVASRYDGKLGTVVPVRVESKRGVTIRGVTERNDAVRYYCERLHHAMKGSACYNVQLMLCKDGRVAAFEINPRVSTTLCLSIAAGVDPIAIFLGEDTNTRWREGLRLTRYWENWIA